MRSNRDKMICGATGKCSVPMWWAGMPAGFCDNPAYGEQYEGSLLPYLYQGPRGKSTPYATGYCCSAHLGPGEADIRFIRENGVFSDWCAFGPDFINLQESVAGFGKTQELAKADYERNLLKDKTNDQTI